MMDPLSEVLRSVRLTGGVFLQAHFTAPWCVTANMDAGDVTPFMGKAPAQLIGYHVVLEGELLVSIGDEPSVKARAGEILLFPRNDGHVLASAPGVKPVSTGSLIQPGPDGLLRVAHGGGGAATRIVCGFLASEEGYNPLIAALPRVLTLDVREGTSRDWIEASVRFAASELAAGRLASSSVMSRLSETLLVEAVRQYASTLAGESGSWLNGINDPQVGRALAVIHHNIGAQWSAEFARQGSRNVAQRLHRPLHHAGRHAADPLPDGLADADGQAEIARGAGPDRQARAFGRLESEEAFSPHSSASSACRPRNGATGRRPADAQLFQDDLDERSSEPAARSFARALPRFMSLASLREAPPRRP